MSSEYFKYQSISSLEGEYSEMLNLFSLLIFGSFVGLPSPPTSVAMRVLPYSLEELIHLVGKSKRIDDQLGDLFDILNAED